jgi:regulator of nonsense transcripts 2
LKTFAAAAAAVDELLASQAQEQDHGDESASEDGSENGEARVPVHEEEEDANPSTMDIEDDDDDNEVVLIGEQHKHNEADEEAQTDFDREFARMLALKAE